MKTTNIMLLACQYVTNYNIISKLTTEQKNCFAVLNNIANNQKSVQAWESVKTWEIIMNADKKDNGWHLLKLIANSSLYPITMDCTDFIEERMDDIIFVANLL